MFTGEWKPCEKKEYFRLLDASSSGAPNLKDERTALFIDPDKGVRSKKSKEHVTVQIIASHVEKYPVESGIDFSHRVYLKMG